MAKTGLDYTALREQFLGTARRYGGQIEHYEHPLKGPRGEGLYTDVASFAKPGTHKWLVSVSGTHGVEGYCGSTCQCAYLDALGETGKLDGGIGVLMIHLINPWGTAWRRRVNEDNIDVNRNYLDFSRPLPSNPGYDAIHELFTVEAASKEGRRNTEKLWADKVREVDRTQLLNVLWAGQYRHPDGLFFGGAKPTWSNLTLHAIFGKYLAGCTDAISFDLHTGAGAYGHPMLMAIAERKYPGIEDACRIYGPWLYTVITATGAVTDTGISAAATGYTSQALVDAMPGKRFTQLVIECGTYTDDEARRSALWNDHFLHLRGELRGPTYDRVKQEILELFFPSDDDWRELVRMRTRQIFDRAFDALTARDQG